MQHFVNCACQIIETINQKNYEKNNVIDEANDDFGIDFKYWIY